MDQAKKKNSDDNEAPNFSPVQTSAAVEAENPTSQPLIGRSTATFAIIMALSGSPAWAVEQAIRSVREQVYVHWDLIVIADGPLSADVGSLLSREMGSDDRITLVGPSTKGTAFSANPWEGTVAKSSFVVFMGRFGLLSPNALDEIAKAVGSVPTAKIFFTDEDRCGGPGPIGTQFKSSWNIEMMRGRNAVGHLCAIETDVVYKADSFYTEQEEVDYYDLILRAVDVVGPSAVLHIPQVLYHCRDAIPPSEEQTMRDAEACRKAVEDHLKRHGLVADVLPHEACPSWRRTRYRLPAKRPKVSLLVPTRDQFELLQRCVGSVLNETAYEELELIVIDNGSSEPRVLDLLANLSSDARVRVLQDGRPFNYSALNNMAAKEATGEILVLLNDDVEALHPEWLEELVSFAVQPTVGAVGAKLFYPDGRIQHAGVVLGIRDGVGDHFHIGEPGDTLGYMGRAALAQDVSAVTGACLAVRRDAYLAVGGLDEQNLPVAFNDVDLCLKLSEAGLRNIWTPFSRLTHHTSATRGSDEHPDRAERARREVAYMKTRWAAEIAGERHFSPHFTRDNANFQPARPAEGAV